VTLSEPQILPDDQPASAGSKKTATPARYRREEPVANEAVGAAAPDQATLEAAKEAPVEQPADPPVGLSRLDVRSAPLTQQQPSTPAPGPKQTPKAPEVRRLQQPLIPDAILRSGMAGEVTVLVEIDAEGKPVSSRVTRSTLPAFNDLFIEAVMASEFWPGVSADGRTTTYLSIPFRVGR
jgi:TonB family protein